ncbi:MAG TPA: hypothetical protein VLJ61_14980 [Pyrinomonadaceae bacterium]|nr:hypothetical protein [Pyrinomonadaceae bacterium]
MTQIKIVSMWGGLGVGKHDELLITHKPGGYFASGKKVQDQLVKNLLDAVDAPALNELDLSNLGLTQDWLDANAEPAVREYADAYYSASAPNLQALYLSSFKNREFIKQLVPSLFPGGWTDDYPRVEVEITDSGGGAIKIASEVQQDYMLPWEVSKDGQTVKTYNADISRALASLLPKKFANRERISGDGFRRTLAEDVMREIKDQWDLLDAENKTGKYLQALKGIYTVEAAELNSYHNVDFGKEWVNGSSGEDNLQATLRRKDLPKNFQIGIALRFKGGEVEGVEGFKNAADRYINLALSVPWVKEYMASKPNMEFELRYVGDRSFSEKAMREFAADMRLKGKDSLVNEVEAVQKDASLLAVGWKYNRDYWIVLPDKRLVLWRYGKYREPIKWEGEHFANWECSSYQGKCIGAVISPDGTVLSK